MRNDRSLIVVGTGIKFLAHLTTEAKAYIQQSEKVLYLVNDPAMKSWIEKNNINATSLDPVYFNYQKRKDAYRAITEVILATVRANKHVCIVMYGHPTVFAEPALQAARIARGEGIYTRILPGISAEACLYADLLIDPGSPGSQCFEATEFLINKRQPDVKSHLVLWQVGMIGAQGAAKEHDNQTGITALRDYLERFYGPMHPIIVYEAAQYVTFEPRIEKVRLKNIDKAILTTLSSLYIPPQGSSLDF